MTTETLHELLSFYESELYRRFRITPCKYSLSKLEQASWRCSEARQYLQEENMELAWREIGFIQCILWCGEIYTEQELREHLKLDEVYSNGR